MGKPKGLFQVLWERKFIDTSKDIYPYYTLLGQEDNYANKIIDTGLREMIQNCLNFIKEETLLQTNALKMGEHIHHIIFKRTPKRHPNIFSEGIE